MSIVEFYETDNGDQPVKDYLLSLPSKERALVVKDIKILELKGNTIREPKSKIVDRKERIFELRSKTNSGTSRIFYFFFSGNKLILTNGFLKKTKKTPKKELEKAINFKHDYERRQ